MRNWLLTILLWTTALGLPAQAQTVTYIHTDALGSPVVETDANRNVIERNEYEPYGRSSKPLDDGPAYTGHVGDAATGLIYAQQRYYDEDIGRFLSADPVAAYGNPLDAFNRYWYASNNPYRFTDPDGREIRFAPGAPPQFMRNFSRAVRYLNSGRAANGIGAIHASDIVVTVKPAADRTNAAQTNYNPETNEVTWADQGAIEVIDSTNGERGVISPALSLGHEFEHAMNDIFGDSIAMDANTFDSQYGTQEERNVIEDYERPAAQRLQEPQRGDHSGKPVEARCPVRECG
ncbi:RHS repeat-associated core domain-containing protein [Marilutibacter maris]|uniref:RHS repeat-associated core domain-containing protein n=1 Tax=Marilutibacter maris TaxID=1605891 RepID=UPI00167ED440|nr:RHS repeat-associated core domain-containing protein [Lysobacter maris]